MRQSNKNRRGFTLLELMIAIGILGIGLSMVMGLFPVAMRDAHATNASQVGSIICKNGIQLAKLVLRESDPIIKALPDNFFNGYKYFAFEYPLNTIPTGPTDYKALTGKAKYGGIVMYRKLKDSTGYMLVCISYARQNNGAIKLVWAKVSPTNVTVVDDVTTITNAPGIPDNSPVIFKYTGKYSRVIRTDSSDGNRKYLNTNIKYTAEDGTYVYGLAEVGNDVFSPALSTIVTITGLRP